MISMTGIDIDLIIVAIAFAVLGAAYAVLGGLRAVAVSDTYGGVLVLVMGLLIVVLSLQAIDYDFLAYRQSSLLGWQFRSRRCIRLTTVLTCLGIPY